MKKVSLAYRAAQRNSTYTNKNTVIGETHRSAFPGTLGFMERMNLEAKWY